MPRGIPNDPAKRQQSTRPKRTPIGTKNVLTAPQRKGFVRRFVNDTPDRIQQFEQAGYTKVIGDVPVGDGEQEKLGSVVTKSVGSGINAVLMEIPEEFYTEDQQAKQREVDATEEQMRPRKSEDEYGLSLIHI